MKEFIPLEGIPFAAGTEFVVSNCDPNVFLIKLLDGRLFEITAMGAISDPKTVPFPDLKEYSFDELLENAGLKI